MDKIFNNISNDSFVIGPLIQEIIVKYFFPALCVTFVTDRNININLYNTQFIYIDIQTTTNFRNDIARSADTGCFNFIVNVHTPFDFLGVFDEVITIDLNQRRDDRKIVVFLSEQSKCGESDVLDVFNTDTAKYTVNFIVIVPRNCSDNSSLFDVIGHKGVGVTRVSSLVVLDTWNTKTNTFLIDNVTIFPDILNNLKGEEVTFATFNYEPYVIFDQKVKEGLEGTEANAAIEFCKWINCTLKILRDDEFEWGEIWDNRSGNGVIGNIVMDRADIGFAALYTWYHEYNFLDLSMPVVRTGITCIAPAPRLLPSWLLPLNPFTLTMWLAVITTILIGTLSTYITGLYNDTNIITWTDSFLVSFGYMLSQPSTFTDLLYRPIVIQLLLLSVVLINAYSSGLSSAVTVPEYESSIDTVQNLVDAKISWGATHDAWIFSILAATEPNLVHLRNVFEKLPDKVLRKRSVERMFAFSIERLPAGHYAIGDYVTEEAIPYLQLMTEDIYWEQCVIMTRKSSPFTKKLNKMIGRLHSAGLLLAWETQVVLKHSNSKVQLGVKLSRSKHLQREAIQLNTRHFQGVYILWVIGAVISTMVFIVEIYFERKM